MKLNKAEVQRLIHWYNFGTEATEKADEELYTRLEEELESWRVDDGEAEAVQQKDKDAGKTQTETPAKT